MFGAYASDRDKKHVLRFALRLFNLRFKDLGKTLPGYTELQTFIIDATKVIGGESMVGEQMSPPTTPRKQVTITISIQEPKNEQKQKQKKNRN